MRPVLLAVGIWMAAPQILCAQAIRGQVVDSVSGAPVGGGFIVLLSGDLKELDRTLADPEGHFVLRAPKPGAYRLRSERIGFRASVSAPQSLPADSVVQFRFVVSALPIRLTTIRVTGDDRCRALAQHRAAQDVWEEARKALAAVAWSQAGARLVVDLRTYDRELNAGLRIQTENDRRLVGLARKPFASPPPGDLARGGYVQSAPDGGLVFHGPDADVLFSDQFLDLHCFRVTKTSDTASLIGLGFEPVRRRRLPDVAGTMWLDASSAELKHIDYWYTNHGLPTVTREAGGRVEFRPLTGGYWIVHRWWIRMPIIQSVTRGSSIRTLAQYPELVGYKEEGGEVVRASLGGTMLMARTARGAVSGRVIQADGEPVRGVTVGLAGTSRSAVSGPDGAVTIPDVADGLYTVTYTHPALPSLGAVALPGVIVSPDSTGATSVQVVIPTIIQLLDQACPDRKVLEHHSAVAGIVNREFGSAAVQGVELRVQWPNWTMVNAAGAIRFENRWQAIEALSDAEGRYLACSLPPEEYVTIWATWRGVQRAVTELIILPDTIHQRNLRTVGDSVFVRN